MKYQVLSDPETATAFRLAGVETFSAGDEEEAERIFCSIVSRGECGLLLVRESLAGRIFDSHRKHLEGSALPLVVPLPLEERWREEGGMDYLLRLIRRAIGYQMKIRR